MLFGVLVLTGAAGVEGVEPGPARVVSCGGLFVVCEASAGWVAAMVPIVVVATGCEGEVDDEVLSACCWGIRVNTVLVLFPSLFD